METFRYGFYLGISDDVAQNGSRKHDENLRASIGNGTAPMVMVYAAPVENESRVTATTRRVVDYYTEGEGARYAGAPLRYWEISNEENAGWLYSCSADEYYLRVRAYASGIKLACPECQVIIGGLLNGMPGESDAVPYLRRFLELGGGEFIDVYNFHYYGTARPVGVGEYYLTGVGVYRAMVGVLEEFGYGDRPIWVTETSTFSGRSGGVVQSEQEQAADLVKRFAILKAIGVEKVFWCFIEEPNYEGWTEEGFFDQSGLVYDGVGPFDPGEGVKKKAYFAYREMAGRLGGNSTFSWIQNDSLTYMAAFSTPRGEVSVLWQDKWNGDREVTVLGEGNLDVYSIYGERLAGGERSVGLELGVEPVYVVGGVTGFEYASPGQLTATSGTLAPA